MSVVLASACKPFQDPTPYELHYSNAYRADFQRDMVAACQELQGYDPDLAAHMTVTGHVGIMLCGAPIKDVFAPVPRESYFRSIWFDIENAAEEIKNNPVYYVLNLCRVLACVEDGLVLSKAQGGAWGMEHLPEAKSLIDSALAAYRENSSLPRENELVSFAEKALIRLRQNADFWGACAQND